MLKIIHTTISPCDNERRIFNQSLSASHHGNLVEIMALKMPKLPEIYLLENVKIRRISIRWRQKGPLKFLSFNWKLFWLLLKSDFDILHCHDLWVLPATALGAFIKKKKMVYDAHEYYRGLEIFKHKKLSKLIWLITEWVFIHRAKVVITINSFHQMLYQNHYPFIQNNKIIMNVPCLKNYQNYLPVPGFSERKNVILFQGIFKPARGLRQAIEAIPGSAEAQLHLIGFGEIENELHNLIKILKLQERVIFRNKISWQQILSETAQAKAGLALFEPSNINYKYASPNKFFEYVMAGTPVIASKIPTFQKFIEEYEVGILVDPNSIHEISEAINKMLKDEYAWIQFHQNCLKARKVWNWENEEKKLVEIYNNILKKPIQS